MCLWSQRLRRHLTMPLPRLTAPHRMPLPLRRQTALTLPRRLPLPILPLVLGIQRRSQLHLQPPAFQPR